jgi:6-phosphogluconolactonase
VTEPVLRVLPDADRLAAAAAEVFVGAALAATRERGRFAVAISGGSTPLRLYRLLARRGHLTPPGPLPWGSIHWFWVDERCVPPDDPRSNHGNWREAMAGAQLPAANVHRIPAELGAAEAAGRYDHTLRQWFATAAAPRFDLVLLGMGADGHTASLFPGSEALTESERWVAAPRVYPSGPARVTLTLPALNAAACVVFLVSGAEKSATLRRVLRGPLDPGALPAQAIRPADGELSWFADQAAAGDADLRERV